MSNPTAKMNGVTFWPIPDFDDLSAVSGARANAYFKRNDLPEVPRKYEDMAQELFFSGGALPEFAPQVDRAKARKAVMAWLSSWEPAHEAKIATVGYALWLWTDEKAIAEAESRAVA